MCKNCFQSVNLQSATFNNRNTPCIGKINFIIHFHFSVQLRVRCTENSRRLNTPTHRHTLCAFSLAGVWFVCSALRMDMPSVDFLSPPSFLPHCRHSHTVHGSSKTLLRSQPTAGKAELLVGRKREFGAGSLTVAPFQQWFNMTHSHLGGLAQLAWALQGEYWSSSERGKGTWSLTCQAGIRERHLELKLEP